MSSDRRHHVRRAPGASEALSRARARTGMELVVVDISDAGARVRASGRLLPGTRGDIHIVCASGRECRRARVAWSHVAGLSASSVRYESGLAFDAPIDSAPRVAPTRARDLARPPGDALPGGDAAPVKESRPAAPGDGQTRGDHLAFELEEEP